MDLKEYKRRIAAKLNSNDNNMVNSISKIAQEHVPKSKKVIRKSKSIPVPLPSENSNDINDESPIDIAGGKLHFLKHMKKLTSDAGKALKTEAINVGSDALNDVKNDVKKEVKSNIKGAVNDAKIMAYQAGKDLLTTAPVAEEAAPLLLAAGMKKPRKQSEKQRNRTILVKKLMAKHNCTLPQASKYIKDHNLSY
jgi:hypothetical protein